MPETDDERDERDERENEAEDQGLLSLAGAVADGEPVDWGAIGTGSQDPMVRRLKQIASLAAAYQAARDAESSAEGAPTTAGEAPGTPLFTWGHLRVLELLGAGAYGEVYRAFDPVLEREVALKLRRADASRGLVGRRALLDEARRLARVRHPNVLTVHGADVHDGRVGLWTDLVVGQTLEERLAQDGPLSAQEARLIGVELCNALAAIHGAGLTHGDVKASNVMRERGGRVVLMDFGAVTESGSDLAQGTPLVLAPEVLGGEAPTPQSDVYSLGVLLYRLVSGRYPVEATSHAELREKHERGEAVSLTDRRPDLPPSFTDVVSRALAPRERRLSSAGALRDALSGAEPAGSVARAAGPRASRRLWLAFAVGGALIVAGALALFEHGFGRSPARLVARTGAELQVDAVLYREANGTAEVLSSGAGVTPGDRLFLEVEAPEPLHVYVLNEDDRGNRYVLFPLDGLDADNPLSAGARHRLPGRRGGVAQSWEVSSAGGREAFLVVASRRALPELERDLASFEAADPTRQPEANVAGPDESGQRGIGGLTPATGAAGRARSLDLLAARIAERQQTERGLWLRQLELFNPGG